MFVFHFKYNHPSDRGKSNTDEVICQTRGAVMCIYSLMRADTHFSDFKCFENGVELDPLYGFLKPRDLHPPIITGETTKEFIEGFLHG